MSPFPITQPPFLSSFQSDMHICTRSSQFISGDVTAVTTTGTHTLDQQRTRTPYSHVIPRSNSVLLTLDPSNTEILTKFNGDNLTSKQVCSHISLYRQLNKNKNKVVDLFFCFRIFECRKWQYTSKMAINITKLYVCLCLFRKQKRIWLNQRSTKRLETYWTQ